MDHLQTYNALKGSVTEFNDLVGHCLIKVEKIGDEEIRMYLSDTNYVRFYHAQDCCESVYIEDICGDLDDLVGSPLLQAEEISGYTADAKGEYDDSYTWTYYRFATRKGSVSVRWYGTSNGYYSESVSVDCVDTTRED